MYTSFDLLARAWVPGGRSRAAWALSPGPLGRLPGGGFDPMCEGQTVAGPLGFRIEFCDDFDVDFCSFGGRSWVPLGGHFRSSWRFIRSKLVPEPSSNRLIFEKVIFHETSAGVVPERFQGPKMAPKTAQDRLKTDPRSSWIGFFDS